MAKLSLQAILLGLLATNASAALDGSRYLWYTAPATDWETGVLPIGNSRLGAAIFGGGNEVVTINEDTLWDGPLQNRIPANGLAALPTVRQMLIANNLSAAGNLVLSQMTPPISGERQFSYFGNLNLNFGHSNGISNYIRSLDTRQGNSSVSYTFNGVTYTREYVASVPAGVIAARFTSSKTGALSVSATFSRISNILSNVASISGGVNTVTLQGSSGQAASDNPILFTGKARFVASGATFSASGGTLTITGATTIDVFLDVETSYRYPTASALAAEVDNKLNTAVSQGFQKVHDAAIADSSALLGRANINFGTSPNGLADLPTDQRVKTARSNFNDPQLAVLAWNYGRHLLVASSRDTSASIDMPPNLQGVWNNATSAPWGGKFTININTEMNLWPAGQTNLIETQLPLFDLLKVAQPRGQEMAQKLYGCGGTVFHHNLDVWGDPAPTDNFTSSTMWPMGATWLVQHMLEQYRFNGDLNFLRNTAYPYLLDISKFLQCYTFTWQGNRVTGPSLSPENTYFVPSGANVAGQQQPMDMAPEMDNQLMRDVMSGIIEAAAALGISSSDSNVQAASKFLPQIRTPRIGSFGQILEWRSEYPETDQGHRHLSPLYGLHPSNQFSPLVNSTLSAAAKALLDHRVAGGSGSTGWSRTWLMNQYARLFSGADVWKHLAAWFATYPTPNLWNTNGGSTFQIDGNFGFTSGVTEMLLQSQTGTVHLLPALPGSNIPTGNVRGLLARGGFQVDIDWQGGNFKTATVTSTRGGQLKLRVANGQSFKVNGATYTGAIQTNSGGKYSITV
ncbi:glycoside hydrolase family 95 [Trichoderma arundinaceum]|uniref:Glycoside hydrolase family 95 n=1 Tax=Trichoderma arundinaceum TaxID=490622 RepID=A0A395NZ50_TRIAR|nr:glycoside hydrolase family 95 [Trichoderma arundinaceum]